MPDEERIVNGKINERLSNGKTYEVFYARGVRYLNATNSADYVGLGRTWFDTRIKDLEARLNIKLKHKFPGRDSYVKIEDLDKYFFTPEEE